MRLFFAKFLFARSLLWDSSVGLFQSSFILLWDLHLVLDCFSHTVIYMESIITEISKHKNMYFIHSNIKINLRYIYKFGKNDLPIVGQKIGYKTMLIGSCRWPSQNLTRNLDRLLNLLLNTPRLNQAIRLKKNRLNRILSHFIS